MTKLKINSKRLLNVNIPITRIVIDKKGNRSSLYEIDPLNYIQTTMIVPNEAEYIRFNSSGKFQFLNKDKNAI